MDNIFLDAKLHAINIINYLKENIQKFKDYYNDSAFAKKMNSIARLAGVKMAYMALTIFYAMKSKDVPIKDKVIMAAALGYFIAPFDLIPDIFGVLGIVDDGIILKWAYDNIRSYITPEIEVKVNEQLKKWFPESEISDLESDLPTKLSKDVK